MNHGVAIRTHRPQVSYWIEIVLLSDSRNRPNVMDVYEPSSSSAINVFKVEAANDAEASPRLNTHLASGATALISVDRHLLFAPLDESAVHSQLVGIIIC